eukprot:8012953-Pyramimonas_sp.AAC.1
MSANWFQDLASGRLSWESAFTHLHALADILPVEGGAAEDTFALVLKQLKSLGCPLWKDMVFDPACDDTLVVLFNVTDGGSDQKKVRKIITVLTAVMSHVLYCDLSCLEHQRHLVVKGGLDLIDKDTL